MADLTYWKGNRSPSITGTITVDGVAFDLTGSSVNFRLRAESSSALALDESAVVVTPAAGTVRYDPSASFAALAAGEYLAWWTVTLPSAKTQDSPEFTIAMLDHAPLTRALCELEDVISYAPGYVSEPGTDSVLEELVRAKSREWHQQAAREFKAITPAVDPRRFDVTQYVTDSRYIRIGDCATVSTVKLYDFDQATLVQTVTSADYILQPRIREEWEPIRGIGFPMVTPNPVFPLPGQVFEISGTWGFVSIPSDIRAAVAGMVVYDYLTKVAESGTAFAEAVAYGAVNVGALYARGQSVLESYATPAVA